MTPSLALLIIGIAFLFVLLSGHPLSFTLGGLGVIFGYTMWNNPAVLNLFVITTNNMAANPSYVCAPLFIFMGGLLEKSGIADDLFDSMYIVLGRLRGGLAITTVVICTMLAAATGVIGAAIGLMSMLALPAMLKHEYDRKLASGTIMAAGCLGQLIPPSIVLIVYGSQAQVPIGKLFAGGIGAGLTLSVLFIIYILVMTYLNPKIAPAIPKVESDKYSAKEKIFMSVKSIVPTMGLIILVLGSIMKGIATPTEGAAVGTIGALLLVIANKKFSWKMIIDTCYTTTQTISMIFWIILTALMFTSVFLGLGGGEVITSFVTNLIFNRWIIVAIIFFIIFVMGMFMDGYGIMMIGIPIFTPIVYSLGFDPLWFGVMFAVMMLVSYMAPPFAYAAFFVKGTSKIDIPMEELYSATLPYLAIYVLGIIILCMFPKLILWIPQNLM